MSDTQWSAAHPVASPERVLGTFPESVVLTIAGVTGDLSLVFGASMTSGLPLPSEQGTIFQGLMTFTGKTRPESGFDCLICALTVLYVR